MSDARAIAFYLPQFHPIPENDLWWGNGFTEWTNVSRARPWFRGHEQPHIPGELGFYDLRVPEIRAQQVSLARKYGLYGFCYYYYWFNGRRLLQRPLEEVLRTGQPDFPFCICWANENWTRRWDGLEQDILLEQAHTEASDLAFIHDVIPIFKDPRYIRVDGAPLLVVYRANILPNVHRTVEIWRTACREAGFPAVHLCAAQTFGITDPLGMGFDAAVEFPPHGMSAGEIGKLKGRDPDFDGKVYDYRDVVKYAISRPPVPYRRYRAVMTNWDNTPRRGARGHVYAHSSPQEYEMWLRAIVADADVTLPPGQRFVFINAWNEWAEGAHLEPDQRHGYAYLEATARALRQRSDWRGILRALRVRDELSPDLLREYVADLEFALESQARAVAYLSRVHALVERLTEESRLAVFSGAVPIALKGKALDGGGLTCLDLTDGVQAPATLVLRRQVRTSLVGWAVAPGLETGNGNLVAYLVLTSEDTGGSFFAPLLHRLPREDVAHHLPAVNRQLTGNAGFCATVWCEHVPAGKYRLGVVHASPAKAIFGSCIQPVQVV